MGLVNIRNTVRAHLFRERFEVLLAVLIPFVFMAESGYACAWILVNGHLGLDFPTLMAFARGFAIEAFVFVCFKLVRIFFLKGMRVTPFFPLLIGLVGVVVSAGMNLGWMIQSPEMRTVMGAMSSYMPGWMANTFRMGLGLLFPVGVALFALFDVRHLVDEMIRSAHLDNRALHVHRAEMHRTAYLKAQKRAKQQVQEQYNDIALVDAQNQVNKVRAGDLSFGADDLAKLPSSVTKITPAQQQTLSQRQTALPLPLAALQQLPPMPPLPPKQPMTNGTSG